MNKEELLVKWLDNDLTSQELETFKALADYESLIKLSNYSKGFKAPNFNTEEALQSTLHSIKVEKSASKNWLQPMLKVAAILAISLGGYYYTTTLDSSFSTDFTEKSSIELPDHSSANLNAHSKITFNKKKWNKNRAITLDGEAFFKVAKGSTFNVKTDAGTITVLGTQFNVKQRDNFFEVICYEGLVGVIYNEQEQLKLKPGESFLIIDGKTIVKDKENANLPHWLTNESPFKSIPYKHVLSEFEIQYNVYFKTEGIDLNQLFTGNFTHDNYQVAIKSITLPLQVTYSKNNNTITLKRE